MGYGFFSFFRPKQGVGQRTHVHQYSNKTSFDVGHIHRMRAVTGPTIRRGSTHVHRLKGETTFDAGHIHRYQSFTGPAIPTKPGFHVHRYQGTVRRAGDPLHVHRFTGTAAPARDDV
ncbi:MAG: hypothetical protein FH756_19565 [Firmicutes bacterium]|nr:hypothetical protein [Bacillota bacterium]